MTSCLCNDCENKKFLLRKAELPNKGVPTNSGERDCFQSEFYDCNPIRLFKQQTEPKEYKDRTIKDINDSVNKRYDKTFREFNTISTNGNQPIKLYSNSDPRLLNAVTATRFYLDRPPNNSVQKLCTLRTDTSLDGYGQNYRNYSDINTGDITYYNDKSIEDAFYEPIYTIPSQTNSFMYKDPMGNLRPQYYRIPVKNNPLTTGNKPPYKFCLSSLNDTNEQREDIMSYQMNKYNRERWSPRWTNNDI